MIQLSRANIKNAMLCQQRELSQIIFVAPPAPRLHYLSIGSGMLVFFSSGPMWETWVKFCGAEIIFDRRISVLIPQTAVVTAYGKKCTPCNNATMNIAHLMQTKIFITMLWPNSAKSTKNSNTKNSNKKKQVLRDQQINN